MTKQEFETRAGHQVSDEMFETINDLYMETEYTKDDFVGMYETASTDARALMIDMSRKIKRLNNKVKGLEADKKYICNAQKSNDKGQAIAILDFMEWHRDLNCDKLYNVALELSSRQFIIDYKLTEGMELNEDERKYLLDLMKKSK